MCAQVEVQGERNEMEPFYKCGSTGSLRKDIWFVETMRITFSDDMVSNCFFDTHHSLNMRQINWVPVQEFPGKESCI